MVSDGPATDLFHYDMELCGAGEAAGADEAGRGCLAGPLVAAAVVFDYSLFESGRFSLLGERLNDSKKLTARVRADLYPLIIQAASRFAVVQSDSGTIDRRGLHRTNLRALAVCLELVAPPNGLVLVDGRQELPDCNLRHTPVKQGDGRSACIAAASVLAKVTRDRVMQRLHRDYPEYGFDSHKGYAAAAHKEAIARHGYTPVHRRSFNISLPDAARP
jgi:ribonuclease HII